MATKKFSFRLAMPGAIADVVLPTIISNINETAPNISFKHIDVAADTLSDKLTNHEIDMAITYDQDLPEPCLNTKLFTDRAVCMAATNHTIFSQKNFNLKTYLSYPHVAISYHNKPILLADQVLKKHGHKERHLMLTSNHSLSILKILENSDNLLTINESFAKLYAKQFNLSYRLAPKFAPPIPIHMVWLPTYQNSPWHSWLRMRIKLLYSKDITR